MQGATEALGATGGFLGTMGTVASTAGSIYNLVGPQSPLVTGNISGLASDFGNIAKGINTFNPQKTAEAVAPKPTVDVATMSRAQPSELAGLPTDIRHQILAAMLKDIK